MGGGGPRMWITKFRSEERRVGHEGWGGGGDFMMEISYAHTRGCILGVI